MWRKFLFPIVPLASLALYVGCSSPSDLPTVQVPETKANQTAGEHAHKPGTHGGLIVEIGRDNYHAEAVFEKGGVVRLYLLGKDEAKVQEVETQTLTAYAKAEGDMESTPIPFQPMPQPGDAPGQTSQFVGQLPQDLWGRKMDVTVPSIRIAGERFRFGFQSAAESDEIAMPDKIEEEEERKLYLTPAGKYTAEDIKVNGNATASQKFKGQMASHDLKPKAGDKICPITLTKANPKFSWIVGGKRYEFCCPPCVDEFVRAAKEQPEEIKEPEAYVKKN
jgi:hypothetical protein